MRNEIGIAHLFGANVKAKNKFINYCKDCDELCEYDYEQIVIDLGLGSLNNTPRYFHFHTGNILDWLETEGYYIGIHVRSDFKRVPVVYTSNGHEKYPQPKKIFSNSRVKSRTEALEIGVQKAIEDLEKQL